MQITPRSHYFLVSHSIFCGENLSNANLLKLILSSNLFEALSYISCRFQNKCKSDKPKRKDSYREANKFFSCVALANPDVEFWFGRTTRFLCGSMFVRFLFVIPETVKGTFIELVESALKHRKSKQNAVKILYTYKSAGHAF